MKNKSMLIGTAIFIENDLNLEDKKRQEEINRWIKLKKGEGWQVKQGTIGQEWREKQIIGKSTGEEINIEINKKKKIIFWNIAGIWNKDKEVWKFVKKGDFISLSETWLEDKDWKKVENKLPTEFYWRAIPAKREAKKGRARDENVIIGGDFNIRIGKEGSLVGSANNEFEMDRRSSKDSIVNNGSKNLTDFCNKRNWSILNGNFVGDEEGNYTFIGARGSTVIDYIIVNEKVRGKVCRFTVDIESSQIIQL
ncbi:hypothetical protein TSAR_011309 [Trichomalopsis sarcophagae]|uniref:Endonuclease/exonuclease/phosphatase domain-containing protein n=1 Tax=Trichomalopsis sarcophagae TaxID=543379 RepID=A0A232EGH5_9HYME|nr:hypothetical protein TSAR_011309 [Trichomalopsis sarcophagae]